MLIPRYIMVGGFLGAGKTSSILKAADYFSRLRLRVGLISNDQSRGLVDTAVLDHHGFPTEEITGGCFCCRFPSLVDAVKNLDRATRPDVFIAEPVGSCTDLIATVVSPLQSMYGDDYSIAPLSVLVDPIRARRFLGLEPGKKFSEKVNYIYDRQLSEADLIVINKIDLLPRAALEQLHEELNSRYPDAHIKCISARQDTGIREWCEHLMDLDPKPRTCMDVDYQVYADGEAMLGWLNATVSLRGPEFDGNQFLVDVLQRILHSIAEIAEDGATVAHLKGTLQPNTGKDLAAANVVHDGGVPELSHRLAEPLEKGMLLINLRAVVSPEQLANCVKNSLSKACVTDSLVWEMTNLEAFRPAPPSPTFRHTNLE